MSSSSKKKFQK